jgi:CHRD domain-containing protein
MANALHRFGEAGTELSEPGARGMAGTLSRHKVSALLLAACFLQVLPGTAAPDDTVFQFRLSPGPRLVGTRADSSGSGSVTATLEGSKLMLKGSFRGLLGVPTSAHLFMGSLPGVRGPLIAGLTVSPATSGTLSGSVQLNPQQLAALRRSSLYVEIDSDKAPEGDLWGWMMAR